MRRKVSPVLLVLNVRITKRKTRVNMLHTILGYLSVTEGDSRRETNRQTGRADRQTERQTDRSTDRQTDTEIDII